MLADTGWIQRVNLVLVGLMVVVAGVGFARAAAPDRQAWRLLVALGTYGACLVASGIFAPDPMAGFPAGSAGDQASLNGVLHLAFGAVGFLALAVAAFTFAGWARAPGSRSAATLSVVAGVVIIAGFAAGAALSTTGWGVLSLWIAVVTGFAWLLGASVDAYRTVPHPDLHRRPTA